MGLLGNILKVPGVIVGEVEDVLEDIFDLD
jgi:hypothetical protein